MGSGEPHTEAACEARKRRQTYSNLVNGLILVEMTRLALRERHEDQAPDDDVLVIKGETAEAELLMESFLRLGTWSHNVGAADE